MWTWIVLAITAVILLLIKWIRDHKHALKTFDRMGIATPKPKLLLGNLSLFPEVGGYKGMMEHLAKEYGPITGYYMGVTPIMVVRDPELVKLIMVKEFQKFNGKMGSPLIPEDSPFEDLFSAEGEKWKRLRTIASSPFSTAKMKEMYPFITKSVDDLINLLDEKCNDGKAFDIHKIFGRLSTDVISSCAFGIDTACLKDEKSEFFVKTVEVMDLFDELPTKIKLGLAFFMLFPGLLSFIRRRICPTFFALEATWHLKTAKKILEDRKSSKDEYQRVDYISLMLEANKQTEGKCMTMEEMQGSLVQFLLGGYESTSSALGFTAYRLAKHREIQEKLQKEIDEVIPDTESEIGYSDLKKLKYLEMVMKEVLRIHPLASMYKDLIIPKGMIIQINMQGLHFDEELWKDPEQFIPERFEEESDETETQNRAAWIPFGLGPRMCVGMRFAIMEYKLTMARILKRFTIQKCPETLDPCPTKVNASLAPSKGVHIMLKQRQ